MDNRKTLLLTAGATTVLFVVLVWFLPSGADFGPTNPYANGLQDFVESWHVVPLPSLGSLPSEPAGTVLVIIPARIQPDAHFRHVRRYLEAGGTVVLFDAGMLGNRLLMALRFRVRFERGTLSDPALNAGFPARPLITDVSILPGQSTVVLDQGTALNGVSGMTVVARSSPQSFLDRGAVPGPRGPRGPFSVAAWTRAGAGTLYIVSDPHLLTNAMIRAADNGRFVRRIFATAGEQPRIFLDTAQLPADNLAATQEALRSARIALASPAVLLIVLMLGSAAPLAGMFRRREEPNVRDK